MSLRVGQGFDAHRFGEGDQVTLGGVSIPFKKGLIAHSDGDVLLHALCDALLGAAGLGDIGRHFPDSDDRFKGIDSRDLLRQVVLLLQNKGWRPVNADMTIIAQLPRLAPHVEQMAINIGADLNLSSELINVKATTTEKMGFTGRGEGIAASAIVLLEPK